MSSKSPSLHELLAVETHLENQANKTRTELIATFEKKRHLFEEKRINFVPSKEGFDADSTIQSTLQSTVKEELAWITPFLTKALDASLQVAEANTVARADIVLEDGTVLATNVPATALLELEKRVSEIKGLIEAIPTLDPAKGFEPDANHGKSTHGVFKARSIRKPRTQKVKEVFVLYPATEQHPAQTQLIDKDVQIGTTEENEWSGLITPAAKADLISRVEVVSRAVRQARSRANSVTVDTSVKIGDKLLSYVINGR